MGSSRMTTPSCGWMVSFTSIYRLQKVEMYKPTKSSTQPADAKGTLPPRTQASAKYKAVREPALALHICTTNSSAVPISVLGNCR
eukprot:45262-Amphidinium_carterae.1